MDKLDQIKFELKDLVDDVMHKYQHGEVSEAFAELTPKISKIKSENLEVIDFEVVSFKIISNDYLLNCEFEVDGGKRR